MKQPQFNASALSELSSKIFFTIAVLILYRFGTYIPLPAVNSEIFKEFIDKNNSGIIGMFNMFSGGALGRMTIFSLAIMPYITASIIIQILSVVYKPLEMIKKEGESGRKKINQYVRYMTVLLAAIQGLGIAFGLKTLHINYQSSLHVPEMFFYLVIVVSLVGGTIFLMWLGEQINGRGIGNGISLIIFTGIISELPAAIYSMFELGRVGAISIISIIMIIAIAIGLIAFVIFCERAFRKITIQYPKRQKGNKIFAADSTHLPLKLNSSGVIPPIFASSLLLFPMTIVNFTGSDSYASSELQRLFAPGSFLYVTLYLTLIVVFCFLYTSIIFNPTETADNLRKNGGYILGRKPGSATAAYLDYVLTRLTVIGAIYLCFVCLIPELFKQVFSINFYVGGTSVLIIVNVTLDLMTQIQTYLMAKQYEGLIKKSKVRL